jgi:hypothetical protein
MRARMPYLLPLHVRRMALQVALSGALLACAAGAARADATEMEGLGLDAQLTGGGGFAFGHRLDNYFLGRVRVGALYARQPWIANLGLTVQLGALARFGAGGELELNHGKGTYGSLGLARVSGDEWMTHATIGFMIFGIEWQHRYSASRPSDALMFEVRLPLGLWWLQKRQESATNKAVDVQRLAQVRPFLPAQVQPVSPTGAASPAPPEPAPPAETPELPLLKPEEENERAQQLAAAERAHARADHAAETLALARAEALRPEVSSALALSAALIEQGKLVVAHAQLQRVLALYALTAEERARAEAELRSVAARLAHLRVIASGAHGHENVSIDGVLEPSALAGYDVPLDPGEHQLQITRAERVLEARSFHASEGELVRVTLELPR